MSSEKKRSEMIDITRNIAELAHGPKIYYHEATEKEVQQLAVESDRYLRSHGIDRKDKDVEVVFRHSKASFARTARAKTARKTIIVIIITDDYIIIIIMR